MVGGKENFPSEAQGPEDLEKGKHGLPGQRQRSTSELLAARQPLLHKFQSGSQTGKRGPRPIQTAEPAAEGGRVWNAIGIFESRRSAFPRTVLQEISSQGLTARYQAVMGIGQRESGKESES